MLELLMADLLDHSVAVKQLGSGWEKHVIAADAVVWTVVARRDKDRWIIKMTVKESIR